VILAFEQNLQKAEVNQCEQRPPAFLVTNSVLLGEVNSDSGVRNFFRPDRPERRLSL
jgi:hypothetical protein